MELGTGMELECRGVEIFSICSLSSRIKWSIYSSSGELPLPLASFMLTACSGSCGALQMPQTLHQVITSLRVQFVGNISVVSIV